MKELEKRIIHNKKTANESNLITEVKTVTGYHFDFQVVQTKK